MTEQPTTELLFNTDSLTFEAAIDRLEELARSLEDGEISIEASLAAYEEGQKLFQFCQQKLQDAEKKLRKLDELTDGVA